MLALPRWEVSTSQPCETPSGPTVLPQKSPHPIPQTQGAASPSTAPRCGSVGCPSSSHANLMPGVRLAMGYAAVHPMPTLCPLTIPQPLTFPAELSAQVSVPRWSAQVPAPRRPLFPYVPAFAHHIRAGRDSPESRSPQPSKTLWHLRAPLLMGCFPPRCCYTLPTGWLCPGWFLCPPWASSPLGPWY